ncbi:dTDP-4-dehydrorhamnose reductase [Phenylobacterium sp.]|uniref:dTDP-4-dehydrorhamnose reductase n=1 Tax=Phenylobacterium sp. TaxID=1871053 RepID=UPI0027374D8C|nr:dTDP-4-dehydrorhamnose reductase [Phenylobacterium sp.]MDP3660507.1 dTDP-4-dehydrorhamnose reductase [Phenylobacterium sp.]
MTLRALQFGASGQLARELCDRAGERVEIKALSRADVDLMDTAAVARAIGAEPVLDLVINAAAYTAVDKAEDEPDLAYAINAWAPAAMAKACAERGAALVHISTDMVFSGAKAAAYVETDAPAPLHVYGASKLAGEQAVLAACDRAVVLRVSWLFSAYGQNFLQAMLRLAQSQPRLRVVADQRARPTASGDLAAFILDQAPRLAAAPAGAKEWGLLHFTNAGVTTRHEMAQAIFALAWPDRPPPEIEPIATRDFPTPARRALNAELDCSRLAQVFGVTPRPWRDALGEAIAALAAAQDRKVA